jgi:hypothetical protein
VRRRSKSGHAKQQQESRPEGWRLSVSAHHFLLPGLGWLQGQESEILTTTLRLPGSWQPSQGPSELSFVPRVLPGTHITS